MASTPKTNTELWVAKFSRNVQRDATNRTQLSQLGWRVEVIWECETENPDILNAKLSEILNINKIRGI